MEIRVGDRVRSHDFAHVYDDPYVDLERVCYVEGTVLEIGNFEEAPGCRRYRIHVDRRFFGGKEVPVHENEQVVYPPVNGTPILGRDRVTSGVERIPEMVEVNGVQFDRAELQRAFDRVANPKDWKAPIAAKLSTLTMTEKILITCAVEFFTATRPTFYTTGSGTVLVHADGYRAGPAGP